MARPSDGQLEALRRAWDRERARREQATLRARQAIGATPRARLTWLLDAFLYPPLPTDPAGQLDLWRHLHELVTAATGGQWAPRVEEAIVEWAQTPGDRAKWPRYSAVDRLLLEESRSRGEAFRFPITKQKTAPALAKAQRVTRVVVEKIAQTWGQMFAHPSLGGLDNPFPEGQTITVEAAGLTFIPRGGGRFDLVQQCWAPLPDAVSIAALTLLAAVPPSLVRRCPYRNGEECGRVFVGVKSQRWCARHRALVRQEQLREGQARHRAKATKRGRRATTRRRGR